MASEYVAHSCNYATYKATVTLVAPHARRSDTGRRGSRSWRPSVVGFGYAERTNRKTGPLSIRHHSVMRKAAILALAGLGLVGSAGAASTAGVYGTVTRSPTKPVCAAEESCSEPSAEPSAHTRLRFLRAGNLVASIVTDTRGRYRIRLPRGLYTVRVAGAPAGGIGGRIDPASVRVRTTWRRQNFDIDTGIR
jgi:hypothetical protein